MAGMKRRYQRTSTTHLGISAQDTFYPSGSAPQLDATFICRFARVGASFNPTSPLATGSFLFVMQINAQNTTRVGLPDLLNTSNWFSPAMDREAPSMAMETRPSIIRRFRGVRRDWPLQAQGRQ
jgi:hypothetical protein